MLSLRSPGAGPVLNAGTAGWLKQNAALLLLGVVLLVSAVVLLTYASGLTYFQDSWEFLLKRRAFTADAYLAPHNEHIVLIPVGIEQLLLRTFGMGSKEPDFVVLTVALLGAATLLFFYVRPRVGPWAALIAATLLLFLGPGWQDLLWPFQVGLVGSLLFGIAMLLALDRDDARGDAAACAFLAVSIGFSSLGVAFAAGAAVDVLQRRRQRGLRRAYLVGIPLLFYAAWYAGWGRDAESHLSLQNVLESPLFVLKGIAGSLGSLLALSTIADETVGRSKWAFVLLAALLALLVYSRWRKRTFSPRLWPVLAAAGTFWFLAAFNYIPGREAYSSRYLYVGAAFVLLIAADLLTVTGVRLGRRTALVAGALAVVVVGFNLVPLREGRDFFRSETVLTRADLAAIEIAQRTVDPNLALTAEIGGSNFLGEVEAGEYLTAMREYGSPAYTPAELADAPEVGRRQADVVLANALPVTTEFGVAAISTTNRRRCVTVRGGAAPPLRIDPGVTEIELPPGGSGTIRLRRFATHGYPLEAEGVEGGSTTVLRIPRDRATRPWRLQVEAAQGATVCL